MSPTALVAAITFGISVVTVGFYHLLLAGPRLRTLRHRLNEAMDASSTGALADPALAKRTEERLAELERVANRAVQRVGFVRYNAFADVGSELSYAVAFLNSEGDGLVLSSIFSREETRTFGKRVRKYVTDQDVSKEERDAIALARTGMSS